MADIRINQELDKSKIEVTEGDIIELALDENPSTGFTWELAEEQNPYLQFLSADFELSGNDALGAPGKRIFRFRVLKKADGCIELENRQKWSNEIYKSFKLFYY